MEKLENDEATKISTYTYTLMSNKTVYVVCMFGNEKILTKRGKW